MNTTRLPDPFSDRRRWQWLALAVVVGVLVWLLSPILTPFVISALLAWLGEPLVRRIERTGRSRTAAVLLVFTLMTLVLVLAVLLLVPLIESQVSKFIDWLPRFGQWLTGTAVPWAEGRFNVELAGYIDPSQLIELFKEHWRQAGGIAATVMGELSKSGMALVSWLVNLALIPVVTFYFMRDGSAMLARVQELLPRPVEPTVTKLAHESDQVLGGFIRGQLSVMIALGTIYAIGLTAVGVDLGILIGLVAGLVSFVPYLGAIVGLGAAVIATLVQHGDLMHLALVLGVFGLGQLLESFWLTPWLVGDKIGLHPVAVIFAIMAGGQLFGFLGVLLALPVAAVAVVVGRYLHERYTHSKLYGADDSPVVVVGATSVPTDAGTEVPPTQDK
ncbi:AI-2E family transporter [Arenimonas soli]|uniref:AI-2E family transporter n=1 Tax=Arenimonas soli TaxID=2269504 RepID=A0ABQ1HRM3_9GAMM|nr:AI-2E family transporter [Arenimonas soli]GGA85725.1 AI-2E family transporter [Arenimonas soli]